MASRHYFRVTGRTFGYALFYSIPICNHFKTYHYDVSRVKGPSMAPALSPDFHETGQRDLVLFRKDFRLEDSYKSEGGDGSKSELERGMVISFRSPLSGLRAIKRVVALEGDEITLLRRPGETVDGLDPIEEESVLVPFGHVWVEGDQVERGKTLDSNDYGPISKSLIEGIAIRIVRPRARRGPVDLHGEWESRCRDRIKKRAELNEPPEEWAHAF